MRLTGDAIRDAEVYTAEMEDALRDLPVCECCEEPIQQDDALYLDDKWYCDDCLRKNRRMID